MPEHEVRKEALLRSFVNMTSGLILSVIGAYFLVLLAISWYTGRKASNDSFFVGDRKSPWYIVAFGMIGASLSGVTFISVPGAVDCSMFGYMQVVFGYLVGYFVIAFVLLPLYYRMQLTSIYTYLQSRFGEASYKTGAFYFLLSRIIGAAARMFLVANVLQEFVFNEWGVPFEVTVALSIALIWVYTSKGGIKTIIWTDTLQTLFLLVAAGVSVVLISTELDFSFSEVFTAISDSEYSQIAMTDDFNSSSHFVKQFLAGIFIAICMTGLDQDMMQKNLSCKNLKEAQKNMVSFSLVLTLVNFLFVGLGALLYFYAYQSGMGDPVNAEGVIDRDLLYPTIALKSDLGIFLGIMFLLGLVAAAYSSADSALTALTTSVCVDFLNIEKKEKDEQVRLRKRMHIVMSVVLLLAIIIFKYTSDKAVIYKLLKYAGFTYGPLLGLFAFGILTKLKVRDHLVPVVCLVCPLLTILLDAYSEELFGDFQFGFALLLVNGTLTFLGMWLLSSGLGKKKAYVPG